MTRRKNSRANAMLIALCVSCSGCFVPDCEEITLSQGQSADGVYGATAYAIDCGAVGDFNLKIRLTEKSASGSTTPREVLSVMGRFTARFDWPESRLLRVAVTCEQADHCTEAQVENVRKQLASSDRVWRDLKVEYAVDGRAAAR
jgi:hypothetical protein